MSQNSLVDPPTLLICSYSPAAQPTEHGLGAQTLCPGSLLTLEQSFLNFWVHNNLQEHVSERKLGVIPHYSNAAGLGRRG